MNNSAKLLQDYTASGQTYNIQGLTLWQMMLVIGAGICSYFAPALVTAMWAGIFAATVIGSVSGRVEWIWYAIAASPGMEIWSRMSGAPLVVDEVGKYYLLLAIAAIILYHFRERSYKPLYNTGLWIIALLIPSLIVSLADFDREQWVFNILALLELSILLVLSARERWDIERFIRTLQFALLPIIAAVIFLAMKSPAIDAMRFSLGANFKAAGGWGSNQVATVLGLGIMLLALLLMLKRPLFALKWISYILIAFLLFRSLLTFSRGGVVSAVAAIGVAMFYIMFSNRKSFAQYFFVLLAFIVIGGLTFVQVNDLAGNKLLQRYMGETPATLSGQSEKTWKKITSGRSDLILADFQIFYEYPLFGVGPGGGKFLRYKYGGPKEAAAHTEFTRLLSEHGLGGLFVSVILLLFPLFWINKQKYALWKGISGALFCMAILTAAHSAMRTNTTTVCYVLAAMPVMIYKQRNTDTTEE